VKRCKRKRLVIAVERSLKIIPTSRKKSSFDKRLALKTGTGYLGHINYDQISIIKSNILLQWNDKMWCLETSQESHEIQAPMGFPGN